MGILKQVLDMMLHEHQYKPITGQLLSIGKQTVNISAENIDKLFNKHQITTGDDWQALTAHNRDTSTRHSHGFITDQGLYSTFCHAQYQCLDISDYEGATIIHDMNEPICERYHRSFDFIYNGSCMDNLFDPVSFIKNTSKMLKPGGRILHLEAMANVTGAFLHFSPEWFYSYYAINRFNDCKVYAFRVDSANSRFEFDSDLFLWSPFFTRQANYDYLSAAKAVDGYMYLLVVAEKGEDSTCDRHPQQMQYIHSGCIDWREHHHQFDNTNRPILGTSHQKRSIKIPFETDHFRYLGSAF